MGCCTSTPVVRNNIYEERPKRLIVSVSERKAEPLGPVEVKDVVESESLKHQTFYDVVEEAVANAKKKPGTGNDPLHSHSRSNSVKLIDENNVPKPEKIPNVHHHGVQQQESVKKTVQDDDYGHEPGGNKDLHSSKAKVSLNLGFEDKSYLQSIQRRVSEPPPSAIIEAESTRLNADAALLRAQSSIIKLEQDVSGYVPFKALASQATDMEKLAEKHAERVRLHATAGVAIEAPSIEEGKKLVKMAVEHAKILKTIEGQETGKLDHGLVLLAEKIAHHASVHSKKIHSFIPAGALVNSASTSARRLFHLISVHASVLEHLVLSKSNLEPQSLVSESAYLLAELAREHSRAIKAKAVIGDIVDIPLAKRARDIADIFSKHYEVLQIDERLELWKVAYKLKQSKELAIKHAESLEAKANTVKTHCNMIEEEAEEVSKSFLAYAEIVQWATEKSNSILSCLAIIASSLSTKSSLHSKKLEIQFSKGSGFDEDDLKKAESLYRASNVIMEQLGLIEKRHAHWSETSKICELAEFLNSTLQEHAQRIQALQASSSAPDALLVEVATRISTTAIELARLLRLGHGHQIILYESVLKTGASLTEEASFHMDVISQKNASRGIVDVELVHEADFYISLLSAHLNLIEVSKTVRLFPDSNLEDESRELLNHLIKYQESLNEKKKSRGFMDSSLVHKFATFAFKVSKHSQKIQKLTSKETKHFYSCLTSCDLLQKSVRSHVSDLGYKATSNSQLTLALVLEAENLASLAKLHYSLLDDSEELNDTTYTSSPLKLFKEGSESLIVKLQSHARLLESKYAANEVVSTALSNNGASLEQSVSIHAQNLQSNKSEILKEDSPSYVVSASFLACQAAMHANVMLIHGLSGEKITPEVVQVAEKLVINFSLHSNFLSSPSISFNSDSEVRMREDICNMAFEHLSLLKSALANEDKAGLLGAVDSAKLALSLISHACHLESSHMEDSELKESSQNWMEWQKLRKKAESHVFVLKSAAISSQLLNQAMLLEAIEISSMIYARLKSLRYRNRTFNPMDEKSISEALALSDQVSQHAKKIASKTNSKFPLESSTVAESAFFSSRVCAHATFLRRNGAIPEKILQNSMVFLESSLHHSQLLASHASKRSPFDNSVLYSSTKLAHLASEHARQLQELSSRTNAHGDLRQISSNISLLDQSVDVLNSLTLLSSAQASMDTSTVFKASILSSTAASLFPIDKLMTSPIPSSFLNSSLISFLHLSADQTKSIAQYWVSKQTVDLDMIASVSQCAAFSACLSAEVHEFSECGVLTDLSIFNEAKSLMQAAESHASTLSKKEQSGHVINPELVSRALQLSAMSSSHAKVLRSHVKSVGSTATSEASSISDSASAHALHMAEKARHNQRIDFASVDEAFLLAKKVSSYIKLLQCQFVDGKISESILFSETLNLISLVTVHTSRLEALAAVNAEVDRFAEEAAVKLVQLVESHSKRLAIKADTHTSIDQPLIDKCTKLIESVSEHANVVQSKRKQGEKVDISLVSSAAKLAVQATSLSEAEREQIQGTTSNGDVIDKWNNHSNELEIRAFKGNNALDMPSLLKSVALSLVASSRVKESATNVFTYTEEEKSELRNEHENEDEEEDSMETDSAEESTFSLPSPSRSDSAEIARDVLNSKRGRSFRAVSHELETDGAKGNHSRPQNRHRSLSPFHSAQKESTKNSHASPKKKDVKMTQKYAHDTSRNSKHASVSSLNLDTINKQEKKPSHSPSSPKHSTERKPFVVPLHTTESKSKPATENKVNSSGGKLHHKIRDITASVAKKPDELKPIAVTHPITPTASHKKFVFESKSGAPATGSKTNTPSTSSPKKRPKTNLKETTLGPSPSTTETVSSSSSGGEFEGFFPQKNLAEVTSGRRTVTESKANIFAITSSESLSRSSSTAETRVENEFLRSLELGEVTLSQNVEKVKPSASKEKISHPLKGQVSQNSESLNQSSLDVQPVSDQLSQPSEKSESSDTISKSNKSLEDPKVNSTRPSPQVQTNESDVASESSSVEPKPPPAPIADPTETPKTTESSLNDSRPSNFTPVITREISFAPIREEFPFDAPVFPKQAKENESKAQPRENVKEDIEVIKKTVQPSDVKVGDLVDPKVQDDQARNFLSSSVSGKPHNLHFHEVVEAKIASNKASHAAREADEAAFLARKELREAQEAMEKAQEQVFDFKKIGKFDQVVKAEMQVVRHQKLLKELGVKVRRLEKLAKEKSVEASIAQHQYKSLLSLQSERIADINAAAYANIGEFKSSSGATTPASGSIKASSEPLDENFHEVEHTEILALSVLEMSEIWNEN